MSDQTYKVGDTIPVGNVILKVVSNEVVPLRPDAAESPVGRELNIGGVGGEKGLRHKMTDKKGNQVTIYRVAGGCTDIFWR